MSDRYSHLLKFMSGQVWAVVPEKLAAIREVVRLRAEGVRFSDSQIKQRLGYDDYEEERPKRKAVKMGGVAVLPLYGFLCPKANMITQHSGGTSLQEFTAMFRAAMADASVGPVVLDIDSGGGSIYGVEELWTEIMNARKVKKIVAVVNPQAGSAAYWIATAAEEIVITPSGDAGSVGVYCIHENLAGAMEKEGVAMEVIQAGQYKTEEHPWGPLTDDAKAYIQGQVDASYQTFLRAVAKGRGVTPAAVAKDFGQGRMLLAKNAVAAGMADRIGTIEEVIGRLAGAKRGGAQGRAASVQNLETGNYLNADQEWESHGFAIPPDVADEFKASVLEVAAADAADAGKLTEEIKAADDGAAERERERARLSLLELG